MVMKRKNSRKMYKLACFGNLLIFFFLEVLVAECIDFSKKQSAWCL